MVFLTNPGNGVVITSPANPPVSFPLTVSTLIGTSSVMTQANLVQSNLQTVAPYSKYAMNFDGTNDYIEISNGTLLNGKTAVSI